MGRVVRYHNGYILRLWRGQKEDIIFIVKLTRGYEWESTKVLIKYAHRYLQENIILKIIGGKHRIKYKHYINDKLCT